jgi:quinolinate synthase
LAPEKKVILPEISAGCCLADTINSENVRELRKKFPEAAVVCYVNSTADVKAESDACCTSANAVKVVNSLPHKQVIFVPDKNLADYVSKHTNKEIIAWEGSCDPHNKTLAQEAKRVKRLYPDAVLMVHPECRSEIVEEADFVGGTTGMMNFVKDSDKDKFIVGTEIGMIYPLKKEYPKKEFYPLSENLICNDMKLINIEKIFYSLKELKPQIKVERCDADKALKALNKMLECS